MECICHGGYILRTYLNVCYPQFKKKNKTKKPSVSLSSLNHCNTLLFLSGLPATETLSTSQLSFQSHQTSCQSLSNKNPPLDKERKSPNGNKAIINNVHCEKSRGSKISIWKCGGKHRRWKKEKRAGDCGIFHNKLCGTIWCLETSCYRCLEFLDPTGLDHRARNCAIFKTRKE